jgi:hypothetical protein
MHWAEEHETQHGKPSSNASPSPKPFSRAGSGALPRVVRSRTRRVTGKSPNKKASGTAVTRPEANLELPLVRKGGAVCMDET